MCSTALPQSRQSRIQIRRDLVLIEAIVTDQTGHPVTGLDGCRFHLFEDGKEQSIQYCSGEDAPVSIGVVLDASSSIDGKLPFPQKAVAQILKALNPRDESFLITFHDRPEVVTPFTSDSERLLRSLNQISTGGTTALYDSIHLALAEMRRSRNQESVAHNFRWRR